MEKGCIHAGLSTPGPQAPSLGGRWGVGWRERQGILGPFGGAEMIGQYKMIRYLKIKTEKECPHPAPPLSQNRCALKLEICQILKL